MSIDKNDINIHYLGHSTFILESDGGKRFIVDPWLDENPKCPDNLKSPDNIDYILITHGHFDHIGDVSKVVSINNDVKVVSNYEVSIWLNSKGIQSTLPMSQGGTQILDGIKVSMVNAVHGSSIFDNNSANLIYGGLAAGYIVESTSGFGVYIAGDTGIFSDMKLIAEIYSPDIAILPIGDNFTMGPMEAFHACKMLNVKYVIPCHYGTFPALHGDSNEFKIIVEKELDTEVCILNPGDEL